jgi:ParB family chromosome partitioning protein
VILGLASAELQASVAKEGVTEESLSVRQTEELGGPPGGAAGAARRRPRQLRWRRHPEPVTVRDPHVVALEDRLRQRLGTKVAVRYRQGRGQIDIRFFSDDELERVLEIVGSPPNGFPAIPCRPHFDPDFR